MSKARYVLTIVLLVLALFWSFASLVGRADSWEEVRIGKTVDWIILGPLWASVIYLTLSGRMAAWPRGRAVAGAAAIIAWVVVALASNWWEDTKVQMRLAHSRRYQRQREQNSSNNAVEPTRALSGASGSP